MADINIKRLEQIRWRRRWSFILTFGYLPGFAAFMILEERLGLPQNVFQTLGLIFAGSWLAALFVLGQMVVWSRCPQCGKCFFFRGFPVLLRFPRRRCINCDFDLRQDA